MKMYIKDEWDERLYQTIDFDTIKSIPFLATTTVC